MKRSKFRQWPKDGKPHIYYNRNRKQWVYSSDNATRERLNDAYVFLLKLNKGETGYTLEDINKNL